MQLRPYQQAAKDTLWRYLEHSDGNPALVLPTGAGKSPLMAAIARDAVENWNGRVMVLAHVQELVAQNAAKLIAYWPEAPMGIYAAGLKRRDRFDKIIYAQIQSVHNRAHSFGHVDILMIDEAHRIPLKSEGTYRRFIADLLKINKNMRVVGLTATPYRLQGRAVAVCQPENILTDIAFEARIPDLIRDGFLSPLVSKAGERPDLSGVHTRGGEYVESELANAMLADGLVERTVADILARAASRKAGIVFCVNVEHAEAVLAALQDRGERAALVHGKTPKAERARLIDAFQAGDLRWMVNVNVLSEGFDAPHIDCVAMLRPTKSPGLMYQQVGRGFRLAEGKVDCLILDYAGNLLEHGPVDQIRVAPARPGKAAEVQTAKAKECPQCAALMPIGMRVCIECGHSFSSAGPNHLDTAIDAPVLASEKERVIRTMTVQSTKYERWAGKDGKPPSLRVTYQCGLRRISEWVCIEHSGFARSKAHQWWIDRGGNRDVPRTVEEALERVWTELKVPASIVIDDTDKFPNVLSATLGERGEVEAAPVDETAPAWLREAMTRRAA